MWRIWEEVIYTTRIELSEYRNIFAHFTTTLNMSKKTLISPILQELPKGYNFYEVFEISLIQL